MMKGNELKGAYVAIVTPFRNGRVDDEGLKQLIEFQIKNDTKGIVVCGTTGESATLSHGEHADTIEKVVNWVDRRVPVVAGTGSNNTIEALELTRHAAKIGADAGLSVCPYYNKPTQEGIIEHFEVLADECDLPLILYNIPGRTGVNMTPKTILYLARHKNIIGIKEASGSMDQVSEIIKDAPEEFTVLSGDDSLTLPIMAAGGRGVVSTTSNVAPRLMAELCEVCLKGKYQEAREIHYRLYPLFKALFCESNPVPAKTALSLMGVITNEVRLPLANLSQEHTELVRSVIKNLGLI